MKLADSNLALRRGGRSLVAAVAAFLLVVLVQSASAQPTTTTALDEATAGVNCAAFFGVRAGPEPLSACQWDMRRIEVGAASYAIATGQASAWA